MMSLRAHSSNEIPIFLIVSPHLFLSINSNQFSSVAYKMLFVVGNRITGFNCQTISECEYNDLGWYVVVDLIFMYVYLFGWLVIFILLLFFIRLVVYVYV